VHIKIFARIANFKVAKKGDREMGGERDFKGKSKK